MQRRAMIDPTYVKTEEDHIRSAQACAVYARPYVNKPGVWPEDIAGLISMCVHELRFTRYAYLLEP